jgi:hypothetical protein
VGARRGAGGDKQKDQTASQLKQAAHSTASHRTTVGVH